MGAHRFIHPILGQEAIVHGGTPRAALGRVVAFTDEHSEQKIEVRTYHDGVQRSYPPHEVSIANAVPAGMRRCK